MDVYSPVFGTFAYQTVEEGGSVENGEEIGAVESMKTMFNMYAPCDGVVKWLFDLGEIVGEGQVVARVE